MINFGAVPIGSVLPVFFDSFAGATGASITLTGLAITDVEIFKGTSMTQRTPDTGVVLLDTDGIDLDGITGIHGFSIDTGDNTDAGFFAAGSFYTVVVSAVTIDTQTVNFVAATFRLLAAEHTAGYPVATIKDGTGTGEINTNGGKVVGVELVDVLTTYTGNTVQTGDTYAKVDTEVASILAAVDTEVGSIKTVTDQFVFGTANRVNAQVFGIEAGAVTAAAVATGAIDADALATDAVVEIADGILNRDLSTGSDSGSPTVRTVRQALRFLRNKWAVVAGTLTVYKEDDSTASWTAAVTGTTGADPTTSVDPAGP